MKKTLAYTATAILLGFAIIMIPRVLEPQQTFMGTAETNTQSRAIPFFPSDASKQGPTQLISKPVNFLPSSLILITGLIAASTTYAILRKRTT
jgi:hypothetical protein